METFSAFIFPIMRILQAVLIACITAFFVSLKVEKVTKKQCLLFSIVNIVISLMTMYQTTDDFLFKTLALIYIIITCVVFAMLIFKVKFKVAFLAYSLPISAIIFLGILLTHTTMIFSSMTYAKIISNNLIRTPLLFINSFILLTCFIGIKKLYLSKSKERKLISNNKMFLFVLLNILFFVVQFSYLIHGHLSFNPNMIFMIITQTFFLIFIVLQKYQLLVKDDLLEQRLAVLEIRNKSLEILVDALRGFKHDFSNIVHTINGYTELNDIEGLKNFTKEGLLPNLQQVNTLSQISPEHVHDNGIYYLLCSKLFEAKKHDIFLEMDIMADLRDLSISTFDFSRMIGILVDNAIEATTLLQDKTKVIKLYMHTDSDKKTTVIKISNKFKPNKDITVENVFSKNFSTKENSSGIGLYELKKIINNSKNISLITNITKNKFTQTISITHENKKKHKH